MIDNNPFLEAIQMAEAAMREMSNLIIEHYEDFEHQNLPAPEDGWV